MKLLNVFIDNEAKPIRPLTEIEKSIVVQQFQADCKEYRAKVLDEAAWLRRWCKRCGEEVQMNDHITELTQKAEELKRQREAVK
jgi:transcription initiation factor IIE alpha subunit